MSRSAGGPTACRGRPPRARSAGPAQVPFLLHVHGSQVVAVRVLAGHREIRLPEVVGGRRPAAKTPPIQGAHAALTAVFGCISVAVRVFVRFTGPFLPLERYVGAPSALWVSR